MVRIFGNGEMTAPELCPFVGGSAVVFTQSSPGKDSPNEDAAALVPIDDDRGVLVVADGVGGHASGDKASRLAIDSLASAVALAAQEERPLREGILSGIESANHAVLDLGTGAATTLAVAQIEKGTVRSFHVGDSMILVAGQRGKIKHQTISHSPVGYAVESGILDEAEAVHHEERHIVSNLVGMPDMRVDMGSKIHLAARDTVVLASDGLFDNLYLEEIIEHVRKGPLAKVARSLLAVGQERMQKHDAKLPSKPDDLTFIVFRSTSVRSA
jgi:serine/threonine protein phosphatase PrpC